MGTDCRRLGILTDHRSSGSCIHGLANALSANASPNMPFSRQKLGVSRRSTILITGLYHSRSASQPITFIHYAIFSGDEGRRRVTDGLPRFRLPLSSRN